MNILAGGAGAQFPRKQLRDRSSASPGDASQATYPTGPVDMDVRLTGLSVAQDALWRFEQESPGSATHHLVFGVTISGPLDTGRLHDALAILAHRHESLRTVFLDARAYPDWELRGRAMILPRPAVALEVADLRHLETPQGEAQAVARAHATRPFDLVREPAWRCLAVTLRPDDHLVQVTQHRLIADARSAAALVGELAAHYEGGEAAEAFAGPLERFADVVRLAQERRETTAHRESVAWWRERLSGLPRLALPATRSPRGRRHLGDVVSVSISPETSLRLRALAQEEGWPLAAAPLAAWACVLQRYTGQDDFGIGIRAPRETQAGATVQGPTSAALVLRCQTLGDGSFRTAARRLVSSLVESLARQEVDAAEVSPLRDKLELDPMVQASFDFEASPGPAGLALREFGGSAWRWADVGRADGAAPGVTRTDVGLALEVRGEGLAGCLIYATDLFDHDFAVAMARAFEALLDAALAAPDTRVADLPLLPDGERRRLLEDWNATDFESGSLGPVHIQVAARAAAAPDDLALSCGAVRLTYGELDRQSNRLARHLRSLGVEAGAVVALCLDRSAEMVVGLLAILKAGGAYLPLDPEYPAARLQFMLADADARVLVSRDALAAHIGEHGGRTVRLDRDATAISACTAEPFSAPTSPSDLAYVVYTSGSTGKPKGVAVHHAGLTNIVAYFAREMSVARTDTLLAVSPLTFDIATLEMWLPLTQGAAIRLLSRAETRDGNALLAEVQGATLMQGTPATWQLLIEAGWTGSPRLRALCGGEALSLDLATQLAQRTMGAWNGYGPTECSIYACVWPIDLARGAVSIGQGVANTRTLVLDANLQLVPVGAPGELFLGGVGVAQGYVGLPELTRERFIPDAFGAPGERLYRTGDHVRWRGDGRLEFLERRDAQVKIRGYRIELGEIEAVLAAHSAVGRCAVIARRGDGRAQLEAYYVPTAAVDADELRRVVRASLPEHMVPVVFVALDALPLSSSGKVDRNALAASAPPVPDCGPAPEGLERTLSEIWRIILKLPTVDLQRSFFEQGGDSLQILMVQRKIRDELGVKVEATDLFRYKTLKELADHVSALSSSVKAADTNPAPSPETAASAVPTFGEDIGSLSAEEVERRLQEHVRQVMSELPEEA